MRLVMKLALGSLALSCATVYGASRSETDCLATGGVWFQDGSDRSCTYTETSSTSQGQGQGQTVEEITIVDSQGNTTNTNKKTYTEDDTCDGPGGSEDNSSHCTN